MKAGYEDEVVCLGLRLAGPATLGASLRARPAAPAIPGNAEAAPRMVLRPRSTELRMSKYSVRQGQQTTTSRSMDQGDKIGV